MPDIRGDTETDYPLGEKARVRQGQEKEVANMLDAEPNGVLNGGGVSHSDRDRVGKSRESCGFAHRVGDPALRCSMCYDQEAWFLGEFDGARRDVARNDGSCFVPEFHLQSRFLARVAQPGEEIFLAGENSRCGQAEQLGARVAEHGAGLKIDVKNLTCD